MTDLPPQLSVVDRLTLFIAEGAGLGRTGVAPGTFGSLWGLALGYGLMTSNATTVVCLTLWLIMLLCGIPLCSRAARLRGAEDPGSIVWDEITAFPLVYSIVDLNWPILLAGFTVFRVFDVAKPWPVRRLERFHGGLGIMADDQMAAVYAAAITFGLQRLVPAFGV